MPKPPLSIVGPGFNIPQPPRPLQRWGQDLWDRVMRAYDISDVGGVEMLTLACQCIDRAEACAEEIAKVGQMIRTKSGMKANPLLRDELANRALAMRTIDKLGINHEMLKPVGRPGVPLHWDGPHED